jgi:hypothetical protein
MRGIFHLAEKLAVFKEGPLLMELATISFSRSKLRRQSKQITVGFEDIKMVGRSVNIEVFQDLTSFRFGYQRLEETLLTT